MARDIRQRALQRIAALSAGSPSTSFDKSDLERLCKASVNPAIPFPTNSGTNVPVARLEVGRVPMVIISPIFAPVVFVCRLLG